MPKNLKFSAEALRRYLDGRPRRWLHNQTRIPELRIRDIFNGVEPKASELILISRAFKANPQDFMVDIEAPDKLELATQEAA
jgi:hypothetical protein